METQANRNDALKVLCLEDSPQDAEIIREMLIDAEIDLSMDCAATEKEFVTFLRSRKYDIILADFKLPGFDVFGALRWCVDICPDVPFICVSGMIGEETAVELIRQGAVDYVLKDRLARLPSAIKRALDEAKEKEVRRRAEEALRYERDFAEGMIETVQTIVLVLDTQGHIVRFNPYMEEISGYSLAEVQGKDWFITFLPERDRERIRRLFLNAIGSIQMKGNVNSIVTKDGCEREIEWYNKALKDVQGNVVGLLSSGQDITERKRTEKQSRLAHDVLKCLNHPESIIDTIRDILLMVKRSMGIEAVGIRLREGDDFPYYETDGFPEHFVLMERYLCAYDEAGKIIRDGKGNPVLECMCGNILCGRTDAKQPFFTESGSFWTNSTTDLLASTTESDRQSRTRNRCNGEGYESVALIPLRSDDEIIGLLQLNDHRRDQFTPEIIAFLEGLSASIGIALFRRRVEEALKESEAKYRNLIDQAWDAIFVIDRTGKMLLLNEQACRLLGYTQEELLQLNVADTYLVEERAIAAQRIAAAQRGEHLRYERSMVRKDGTIFPVEVAIGMLPSGLIQGIVRDITERKQAEEALKKSEGKFRAIFDNASDGMFLLDLKTRKFLMCNNACAKMLGYAQEEFSNLDIDDIHPGEDLPLIYEQIGKFSRGEKGIRSDIRFKRKDGSVFAADLSPALLIIVEKKYLLIIFKDITERKRAEDALKESEEKFRNYIESAPDGIFIVDNTGRYIEANKSACRITGYSKEEIEKMFIHDLLAEESLEDGLAHFKKLMETGAATSDLWHKHKDGSKRCLTVDVVKFSEMRALGFCKDITKRKRAEEALRESEEKHKALIETTDTGYLILDAQGRVIDANKEYIRLTGYDTLDEILGRRVVEWTAPHDLERNATEVKKCAEQGYVRNLEIDYINRSEQITPIEINATVVGSGESVRILSLCRDITERKRAEEALCAGEKQLRFVSDHAPVFIAQCDHERRYKFVNKPYAEMFGLQPADIIGKHPRDVLGEEAYAQASSHMKAALAGQPTEYDLVLQAIPGGSRAVHASYMPERDAFGRVVGFIAAISDITERKRAEEQIRQLNRLLRTITEINQLIVRETDRELLLSNACRILVEHGGFRMAWVGFADRATGQVRPAASAGADEGYLREVVIRCDDTPEGRGPTGTAIRTGAHEVYPDLEKAPGYESCRAAGLKRGYRSSGAFPLKVRGDVVGTLNVYAAEVGAIGHEDIALLDELTNDLGYALQAMEERVERRRAVEALRESEEWFRTLADTTSTGIFIYQDDRFVYVNRANGMLSGYTAEEFLALRFWDVIHPDCRELVRERGLARQRGESVTDRYEVKILCKNGEERWIDFTGGKIDWQGQPAVLGTAFDITERKQAEEQIRKDLEEKNVMLKEIHHRVKNNLNVIISLLSLQADRITDKSQALAAFEESKNRIYAMALVHDNLYKEQNFSRVNLNSFIENMTQNLVKVYQPGTKIEIRIEDISLDLNNAIPCGLILNELVTNALKYAFQDDRRGLITIGFRMLKGKTYELTVQDNGVGLPKDIDVHKTKSLGLLIVNQLIKQIEGVLKITRGKGTKFQINFPVLKL